VRAVDKGLSTGGNPAVELTGASSHPSAGVIGALSSSSCFSARRRFRFSDLGVPGFSTLRSEVVCCFERGIVAIVIDGLRSSAG
jgi:hypothetical protein